MSEHVGICNVWNEIIGNRGSAEIASLVYTFLREKSQTGVKEFYLRSDSCGGQNRNQNVLSMLLKACNDFNVTINFG